MTSPEAFTFLPQRQQELLFNPAEGIEEDLDTIYLLGQCEVGWPTGARKIYEHLARENTVLVAGIALGDEGKGRITDNVIGELLKIPGVKMVYAIRVQGGNNAGHTAETGGLKIALHLVPSGVMYEEVVGIMDSGMVIHPDLQTEVELIEEKVGDLRNKLILSEEAILATDLERAEELLNRRKKGDTKGGTGRGMSPAYAGHINRLGFHVIEFLQNNWKEEFGKQYDRYVQEFNIYRLNLADVEVIDFRETKRIGKETLRRVGTREEYLDRLESFRTWLLEREIVKNTFPIHKDTYKDLEKGVLVELAQALGLHKDLGTRPDVTSSDTSGYGVMSGTHWWKLDDLWDRIGVFKITYTSSVGARRMPTQVELSKDVKSPDDLPDDAAPEQKWAAYVRHVGHEVGTTTGRFRDILHLDLEMMRYNCRMAGIEMLAGTHLDIARKGENILVCTHYTKDDRVVPYQPGLRHLEGVTPHYVELPGWDGEAVRRAKSFAELPENARKFLAFIQRRPEKFSHQHQTILLYLLYKLNKYQGQPEAFWKPAEVASSISFFYSTPTIFYQRSKVLYFQQLLEYKKAHQRN